MPNSVVVDFDCERRVSVDSRRFCLCTEEETQRKWEDAGRKDEEPR